MRNALKDLERLRQKHKGKGRLRAAFPNLKEANAPVLSQTIAVAQTGFKRDPLAYKWKKGAEETPETIREIQAKAKRVTSLFHKGGLQYIAPGTDATHIGRK